VPADRCHAVDRTFEAVEDMPHSLSLDDDRHSVIITANLACAHGTVGYSADRHRVANFGLSAHDQLDLRGRGHRPEFGTDVRALDAQPAAPTHSIRPGRRIRRRSGLHMDALGGHPHLRRMRSG
jgi:hypothetical protein